MKLTVTVEHEVKYEEEVLNLIIPPPEYFKTRTHKQMFQFMEDLGKLIKADAGHNAVNIVLDQSRNNLRYNELSTWAFGILAYAIDKQDITIELTAGDETQYYVDGKKVELPLVQSDLKFVMS